MTGMKEQQQKKATGKKLDGIKITLNRTLE